MKLLSTTASVLFVLLISLSVQGGLAQTPNQAGLVVEFDGGSLFTACIAFEGESITGYEVLARSGLSLETAFDPSQGVAVCKIESDGCPADDCFCQMPEYWSYWNLGGGGWIYAGSGASTNRLSDGDVDGWSWGTGNPPPVMTFNQLCAPPPPPPPTSTSAPELQPSDTPEPEPTHSGTPKPQPSDTPEPEPTDTFIPPTYTEVPSYTPLPDSPTPSLTASHTPTIFISKTVAVQTTQRDVKATPSSISLSVNSENISAPAPTRTETPKISPTPETKNGDNNYNELIGYAVFGALLIGLGLALTRIIMKGRKP